METKKYIYHDQYLKNGLMKINNGSWFKDKDYIHNKGGIYRKINGKLINVKNIKKIKLYENAIRNNGEIDEAKEYVFQTI